MFDQLFILVIILFPKLHHPSLCFLALCRHLSQGLGIDFQISRICVKPGLKTFQATSISAFVGWRTWSKHWNCFPSKFTHSALGKPISLFCELQRGENSAFSSFYSLFFPLYSPRAPDPRLQLPPAQLKKASESLFCLSAGSELYWNNSEFAVKGMDVKF